VAVGLLVGVAAALLLAPQSGAETRQDLSRRLRRAGRRSRDAWDDLRDELRSARLELKRVRRRAQFSRAEAREVRRAREIEEN